ncbi:PREDICTED: basic helix-loop-helix domain-containing protein USF3 [Nanorana parkeri]|uniref:basic helix-loop-helix domain-containing protein USF3 n=1 Tax=Nanorana parkeri TaxID=125878 RepID=UPI0008549AD3|nr:PREDICTED: basic helix-loop-helix domain-containing protein USF3 [Nanorana parkeri]
MFVHICCRRKKNRESHNEVERHRKKKINSGINRVGDLIPCSPALKQSKNMILEQAYKYITELKRQNDELLLNAGDQEQAREIRKLRRELADIQKENARYIELLKSNDICLYDDPTLHWKGNSKRAKASLIAPADQKLPLCLSSNQLASSNQGSTVHGITFNVGQSLQKQTANVVPVQRTCNLVTPVSISGVYPLDKAWQQNATSATTTTQQVSLCLPVTTTTPTTADLASSKGTQTVLFHTNSVAHLSLPSTSAGSQFFTSSQSAQPSTLTVSTVANIPSQPSLLASQVGMQSPSSSHGKISEAAGCAEAVKDLVKEIFPSVHIESSPEVVSSRDINPSVEVPTASASSSCLETSWFLSNNLPELRSVGSISRIPSDGNTQTTWTTLQLAGNTVQPLSHSSSGAVPALLVEQAVASKDKMNQQMPACVNISSILASENRTGEPVMVQMPPGQPVTVQPFKTPTQPQSTTNLLPLNQPVQVIQVAQPFNAALNPAPANQNIILLQPPAPTPCPPVPNPTVGQQIVIIQAAPNQNPIPLVSAQPSPTVVMPMNAPNPVVCPANPVQSIVAPQTFGAKHLVHILPRPAPVQPSVSTQVSASTATSNQQPPTFSLNGQLFALQPVTPSAGSSSQAPMQIIQPTTSEDPNTNVALNTFGALATLSQSISQMGGQNCVQFTLNPSVTPSLAANNQPVNCASVPRSSVMTATAETSVAPASVLTKSSSVKPVHGPAPNTKPKKNIKKPNVKKGGPLKKESTPTVTPDGSSEASKSQAHGDEQNQMEKLSVLVTAPITTQEKTSATDGVSQNIDQTQDTAGAEACASAALNMGMEGDILSESVSHEHAPAEFSAAGDFVAEEVCVHQNEKRPPSVAPASPKAEVAAATLPLKEQPVQDSLQVDPSVVTIHEHSHSASKDCLIQGDAADLTPVDLLEVQILSDDPNMKSLEKVTTDVPDGSNTLYSEAKSNDALTVASTDSIILTTSVVHIAQTQPSTSEHEVVGSCANSRQTDSPMSNGSGSGRNFTVASMLPDTSRVDTTNPISSAPPFNGCSFSEQSEIVPTAARAIFDQENLTKEKTRMQAEAEEAVSKNTEVVMPGDCCLPFKPHSAKEGICGLPSVSHSFSTTETNAPSTHDRLMDKTHCTLGLNTANLSLQMASSQSQSVTSLSINNLIHQRGIMHSAANSASVSQASEHLHLSTSTSSSMPSSSYEGHSSGTMVLSEYHQNELHSVKASVMQVPSNTDSHLKQSLDVRKESTKRAAHGDELLSAAKRQKQCHGPMRIERIQQRDGVAEQNEMLVGQMPSDSSSLSGSIQGHGEGISSLFSASNNFAPPNLRQSDMRCNSQPSISEQSQMGNQHLQPLQQHQQAALLHNSNPYLKQQQSGHMRDQHHLYQQQQQQHHLQLADSSVHAQSHNVQQQRMLQQDVQMQKKRNSIQGAQVARLSLQQKQLPEQNRQNSAQAHSHHQQIQQQMPAHFGSSQAEKSCENTSSARGLHGTHQQSHMSQDMLRQHQQDINNRAQGSVVSTEHLPGLGQVQRLMTSRSLEQQLVSQPSVVSRNTNMSMSTSHRQERNRVSSYSAEALIGKSTSNSEQRLGISVQASRVSEQMEMRKYLDASRNKVMSTHNIQSRMTMEHSVNTDSQRLADCQTFKPGGMNQQQQPPASFEVPTSRNNDGGTTANMRSLHSQTYRSNQNPNSAMERQKHLPYQTVQEVQVANTLPIRDHDNSCHQSFMQSLLAPHLGEQVGSNQRGISGPQRPQYNSSSGLEFGCPPTRDALHLRRDGEVHNRESCDLVMGQVTSRNNSLNIPFSSSSGDIQGRNTSPHNTMQKSHSIRQIDSQGAKNQLNIQVSINMHGVVHPPIPHQSVSHGNVDQRQTTRQVNPPVPQRSRHPLQEESDSKSRPPERNRTGSQRHSNMFDPTLPHLPLAGPGSMILGRQQPVTEKRPGIVRFMPDASQVPTDNSGPDQHTLTQNFAFPFMPEGTMNPPINANASFMPPVTQATATRTSALIQVDPQNTLPSFYPPYSPAHPSLSNDLTLPYFSNQMFPNPGTEKTNSSGLNNRFGSILSPPRPVGFSQTTFPLLPEMPPMHMANPSHLSNFNLTSLFPEIATALPPDGSAMSPLLSISHPSASDSSKQTSNRPAHNISHILGHDSSSAV